MYLMAKSFLYARGAFEVSSYREIRIEQVSYISSVYGLLLEYFAFEKIVKSLRASIHSKWDITFIDFSCMRNTIKEKKKFLCNVGILTVIIELC